MSDEIGRQTVARDFDERIGRRLAPRLIVRRTGARHDAEELAQVVLTHDIFRRAQLEKKNCQNSLTSSCCVFYLLTHSSESLTKELVQIVATTLIDVLPPRRAVPIVVVSALVQNPGSRRQIEKEIERFDERRRQIGAGHRIADRSAAGDEQVHRVEHVPSGARRSFVGSILEKSRQLIARHLRLRMDGVTANFGDEQLGDVAREYRRFGEAFDDFRRARRAEHLAEDGEHFDEMAFFRFAIVRRHVVVFDEETSKVNRACKTKETKETSFCFFCLYNKGTELTESVPRWGTRRRNAVLATRRSSTAEKASNPIHRHLREGEMVTSNWNERRLRLRKVTAGVKKYTNSALVLYSPTSIQSLSMVFS